MCIHVGVVCVHVCMPLCIYYHSMHCIRSWRNNISSKVSTPIQLEVYQTLCIMESELDEVIFAKLIKSFVQQWEKKEPTFTKYFQDYYCPRTGKHVINVSKYMDVIM